MWVWFGSRSWSKDLAALGPLVMTPSQILVPVRPYHSAMSTQYFGFVRHTVITNDVIEREKWKVLFFFTLF